MRKIVLTLAGKGVVFALLLLSSPPMGLAADSGLITKPSTHSAQETIERFETAVKAKGWIVFAELDHAAAAAKAGLELPPRTVIAFGNPTAGTAPMRKAPTLAIDLPLKALVWQADNGKVWLTYSTGEYIADYVYARHGLSMSAEAREKLDGFLNQVSDQATK